MNYLAHAWFSFHKPEWRVGNLISDFVKGKQQYDYPKDIHLGIRLHRAIDGFTDSHPATAAAKAIFRPHYRLYAGAFIDVVYDHFLANDPACFATEAELDAFAQETYRQLRAHEDWIPARAQAMFARMRQQNWLYHYRSAWGMSKSFGGLVYRSRYLTDSDTAFELFSQNTAFLESCYQQFVPDLRIMLDQWRQENGG